MLKNNIPLIKVGQNLRDNQGIVFKVKDFEGFIVTDDGRKIDLRQIVLVSDEYEKEMEEISFKGVF